MYLSIHLLKDILKWSRSVMSNSLRPHGLQPTRLLSPWDFPGKNNGLGCHLSRYEALFCQLWIKLLLTSVCKVLCGYKFQLLCNYQGAWLPNHMVVDVQFSKKYSNNLLKWLNHFHSHWQWMKVSVAPHPHCHLVLSVFLILDILIGV